MTRKTGSSPRRWSSPFSSSAFVVMPVAPRRPGAVGRPQVGTPVKLAGGGVGPGRPHPAPGALEGLPLCTESARFYRRLARESQGGGVQVVAVLPQDVPTAAAT